jgi:molybdate transport system substrate-binding protein
VELGFQQLSELQNLPGIEILGPLPASIQLITVFSGGVSAKSSDAAAARALLQYLASPQAATVKVRFGMESA